MPPSDNTSTPQSDILIYRTEDGRMKISVRLEEETVWLSQIALANLFETTKQDISLHIRNILEEGELSANSVVKEYLTTAVDGKQYRVKHYNLDM
ncbi:MAG TPA: cell filamentation protein Fic, partial [Candidatus Hydrogenedentes bacterium]|nr:cell filamentation protein Fic [Candidatus Hydrogenedentota bacterium]